jgi:hypothetical protein
LSTATKKVPKENAAPIRSHPFKKTGVPSSITIGSAAAGLAIKNMAQTVLAENFLTDHARLSELKWGLKNETRFNVLASIIILCFWNKNMLVHAKMLTHPPLRTSRGRQAKAGSWCEDV